MERYNWQDREDYRDNRRSDRNDQRRSDESEYRGAYRLDNESNYGMDNRGHYRQNEDQGGDYVYRRSRNLQDNDGYTEQQYRQSYPSNSDRHGRYSGDNADRQRNRFRSEGQGSQNYRSRYDEGIAGNFDGDYAPDRYRNRPGENYGNMAGSLSFGYDGDYNSDPDYNRRYNPLTGEIRQRQENHSERHPRRYGPPDRTGSNPDYDRY